MDVFQKKNSFLKNHSNLQIFEEKRMRKIQESQMQLGELDISQIRFDLRSRDEIPKLLMGLQHLYATPQLRDSVFKILEKIIPNNRSKEKGRPGMTLWKILVLGTLRLNCNWDYDKVHEMANQHRTLRQMMGHGMLDDDLEYAIQTIKDNVHLLTPEILDEINILVVSEGHKLVMGKKKKTILKGSCDSFVVETNVHFPTDINLLWDAIRKTIEMTGSFFERYELDGWRQWKHQLKKIKGLFRKCQTLKHSNSKDDSKKEKKEKEIIVAYEAYLAAVEEQLCRAENSLKNIIEQISFVSATNIKSYIDHAKRQIDQVRRRVVQDETIRHGEKVFSIFEEHTEWIVKGKAGVAQELGLLVNVVKDQFGFILHHKVVEKQKDVQVTVDMVKETQQRFPDLKACSFDKGYYSSENKENLEKILDHVILPKKGRLSKKDKEVESSPEFKESKKKHSAVEAAISTLENHGLDRCCDHGRDGFKRYVALAVAARNIQHLGQQIQNRNIKQQNRVRSKKAA